MGNARRQGRSGEWREKISPQRTQRARRREEVRKEKRDEWVEAWPRSLRYEPAKDAGSLVGMTGCGIRGWTLEVESGTEGGKAGARLPHSKGRTHTQKRGVGHPAQAVRNGKCRGETRRARGLALRYRIRKRPPQTAAATRKDPRCKSGTWGTLQEDGRAD